ncbi:MAG TPA: alkaline phosphatase family protein [Galbitalea sp.]|jgi:predicted AlkP superfamily pyrophosphatase or phosphodiesterase|nr:alkaline phosphatase family protein [Galbitalea sp.]
MLPGPNHDRISLADVLTSCLSALGAQANALGLPVAHRMVVILVDGLGTASLRARAGHARFMATAPGSSSSIDSVFPTTTAAALASLATGAMPGTHGLVGYTVVDRSNDRVINQLTGWDDRLDPDTWQREPTVFERVSASGLSAVAVAPARYANSGFTRAVLRGSEYRSATSIADRFRVAARWLREPGPPGLLYLYIPELDSIAHKKGWESSDWTSRLEQVDAELRRFAGSLRPGDGVLLTADHGVVDVPERAHILIDSAPELLKGVRFVAGEPRCLQLTFSDGLDELGREGVAQAWRDAESDRSWVVTRSEAIEAGWFGEVVDEVSPRIGDLLVAARKNIAYYDSRTATKTSMAMIGQHGSWSPAEVQVPLLRFGAFA